MSNLGISEHNLRKLYPSELYYGRGWVTYEGMLSKHQPHAFISTWKNRYCILIGTEQKFYYFDDQLNDAEAKGQICLQSAQVECHLDQDNKDKSGFDFTIIGQNPARREYYFKASTELEATSWVEEINKLIGAQRQFFYLTKCMSKSRKELL